jgi:hypothetical protein
MTVRVGEGVDRSNDFGRQGKSEEASEMQPHPCKAQGWATRL